MTENKKISRRQKLLFYSIHGFVFRGTANKHLIVDAN